MPAAAVLALILALAPAPTPSGSTGPVGDLLGGVGDLVDGLLPGGADATPAPSATPSVGSPTASPSDPSPPLSRSAGPTPGAPRPSSVATDAVRRAAAVPQRPGPTPGTREGRAAPPAGSEQGADRRMAYAAGAGVLAVAALVLLWRRRRSVPGPAVTPAETGGPTWPGVPAASGPSGVVPPSDGDPAPDNVTRLPTDLNAIYELGRLDERLRQQREPGT
ncbi:hypothetical protein [Micromonospora sp. NPDC049497]|uniref:hypothetical protein n=1 Tax=Micromonospora sp. NPDC049497 TaxID=3364273 RepID=UPI00379BEC38